jgi:hypothetical protein
LERKLRDNHTTGWLLALRREITTPHNIIWRGGGRPAATDICDLITALKITNFSYAFIAILRNDMNTVYHQTACVKVWPCFLLQFLQTNIKSVPQNLPTVGKNLLRRPRNRWKDINLLKLSGNFTYDQV